MAASDVYTQFPGVPDGAVGQCALSELSFFCPAYNEAENLPRFIADVHAFLSRVSRTFEIIIVDDGSRDGTPEIADSLAKKYDSVRVVHHRKNMGYGVALRDGFLEARYEYVAYADSDNQYDVRELAPLFCRLDEYDVISCYAKKKAVTPYRKFQSAVYNVCVRLLFGVRFRDVNCSMKLYKRSVLRAIAIRSASAFIDAEMLVKARRKGFRILQAPVTHYERTKGIATGSRFKVVWDTVKDMAAFRLGMLK